MSGLRIFLILSTLAIYAITLAAVAKFGFNWPAVYFGDLVRLDWRSQFNADFLIHLFLLASWIAWREGFSPKGYLFGFLSISFGGMFGFPYILFAIHQAKGDPKRMLLGKHA
ncbi:MAG: hypothetical protein AAF495_20640 [Pseudomonadota bacterium]